MIGKNKNKIDAIWLTFWEKAGITNPMDVLEPEGFRDQIKKKIENNYNKYFPAQ